MFFFVLYWVYNHTSPWHVPERKTRRMRHTLIHHVTTMIPLRLLSRDGIARPKWIGIRRSEAALSIFLQRHLITGAQSRSSGLHRMCIICLLLPSHISFPFSLPPSLILPPLSFFFFFSFPTLAFLASNCRFFLVFATELASSTLELSN